MRKTWCLTRRPPASPTSCTAGGGLPPAVLTIPAGVAHWCRAIGTEVAHRFYGASSTYDPAEDGRIRCDGPEIGYDWLHVPPKPPK